jgi:phosphomannomutase
MLAHDTRRVSEIRRALPEYCISKNRIDLTPDTDVDAILHRVKELYRNERVDDRDGVKIDFAEGWVHLRKSNTEPIIRVYSEAATMDAANALAQSVMNVIQ